MYRDNDENILRQKRMWIENAADEMSCILAKSRIYHYTSMKILFDILEGDSFWVSNARFSNDATEEGLLPYERMCEEDNFIICFCEEGDQLSQWRGYCHQGGASIKFDMREAGNYSVLHAEYDKNHKYEIYCNAPLPVLYIDDDPAQLKIIADYLKSGKDRYKPALVDDMIPYFKNSKFYEEKELRMVFTNFEGNLSSCIRFRNLQNGVKVPYMVVKSGDVGQNFRKCPIDVSKYDDVLLKKHFETRQNIIIPEGSDQENVYYQISKKVKEYAKKNGEDYRKIRIYCKGHLPVEKITIAPRYDRELLMEQVKSYCISKYWLRDVVVEASKIPFVQPLI